MCEYAIGTSNGEVIYAECGGERDVDTYAIAEQVASLIVGASVEQTPDPERTYQELTASRLQTSC